MKQDPITYRDLLKYLSDTIDPNNLDCHVTVCVDGEFFQAVLLESQDNDILDDTHPYLEAIQ